jgi:hypothetical protein
LAWRLQLAVLVPTGVASAPRPENWEWWPDAPCATVAEPNVVAAFRPFLDEADPDDYDW